MTKPPSHPPTERPIKLVTYLMTGAVTLAAIVAIVAMPQTERFHAKGPANTGHAALACADCHKAAPGTVRQQLQAKVRFWLGLRATDVAFGQSRVSNEQCIACHTRDQDPHAVHRFLEPRFAKARAELGADSCVSCHREHTGVRVTMAATSCASCHADLVLKREPLDVSHRELIARKDWTSCLGCHDYHGNHKRAAQTRLDAAYPLSAVTAYFAGGPSPYGKDLKYPTKTGGH
jgi:cytochrome c3-like protein